MFSGLSVNEAGIQHLKIQGIIQMKGKQNLVVFQE